MKTKRVKEYITVQGERLKTTGKEMTLYEVMNDDYITGVAVQLNGGDIDLNNMTIGKFRFLMAACNFVVVDILCSLLLVQGTSANEIHEIVTRMVDEGIKGFDRRVPADLVDEAERFGKFVMEQGLSEDELTRDKLKELAEKFRNGER